MPKIAAPISCLVTVYNCEDYIAEAIESLLAQTLRIAEIIIVDDGSTDKSYDIAKSVGGDHVRLIQQENKGIAGGRNRALQEITQPFVMFMDADDISVKTRVELSYSKLMQDSAVPAVFGKWKNFWIDELSDEEMASQTEIHKGDRATKLTCNGLYRSDAIRQIGTFDETLDGYSEVEWLSRLDVQFGAATFLGELTYLRRIHRHNHSRKRPENALFNMVRKHRQANRA